MIADSDLTRTAGIAQRTEALYLERQAEIARHTDWLFVGLMVVQWIACILGALFLSPVTWSGAESTIHIHVWAALLLGGAITLLPVFLVYRRPADTLNRHVIAIAQMLFSGLLIQVTGGRIETHFHVFGSLAFLAFYRDWRVFIPATLVVGLDHLVRGMIWPQSVYGVLSSSPWRSAEHAGWVVFENIFLVHTCIRSVREMRALARQQAQLEATKEIVEAEVKTRTQELGAAQRQLLDASRRAGMAEIATGVLHNVGNVLNSVNVSTTLIHDLLRKSKLPGVASTADLMQQHAETLGEFITQDARGKQLPRYLLGLADVLEDEHSRISAEVASLAKSVEHIKTIVSTQQKYARVSGVVEIVSVPDLVEDALRMSADALERHGIQVIRELGAAQRPVALDRQSVVQVLINLLRNAKQAMCERGGSERRLTVRADTNAPGLRIEVADTGIGIAQENLTRIFSHGFTTKKDGNGFGLHSSALAMQTMGGRLTARSDGLGKGATFILELPVEQKELRT